MKVKKMVTEVSGQRRMSVCTCNWRRPRLSKGHTCRAKECVSEGGSE